MSQGEEKTNNTYLENIKYYHYVKNILTALIQNKVETIILIGSGSNGKSYLMKQCSNLIIENNYLVVEEINTKVSSYQLQQYLISLPDKKILHLNNNPFRYHNIDLPTNYVIINMNHIYFNNI